MVVVWMVTNSKWHFDFVMPRGTPRPMVDRVAGSKAVLP
jgi:hypothetical protein